MALICGILDSDIADLEGAPNVVIAGSMKKTERNHGYLVCEAIRSAIVLSHTNRQVQYRVWGVDLTAESCYRDIVEGLRWIGGCHILNVSMGWKAHDPDIANIIRSIRCFVAHSQDVQYPALYIDESNGSKVVHDSADLVLDGRVCTGTSFGCAMATAEWLLRHEARENRPLMVPEVLPTKQITYRQINV